MSVVGSIFSTQTARSSYRLHVSPTVASAMDNLFAIAFGLGLRYVIAAVGHNDLKLTAVLIGLWEGAVTLHFVQKAPRSLDPYVAYGVRMFVDFLVTENVFRMVLVLLWTGLGMVLADITPALWEDTGMRRFWSRFVRDMSIISRSIALSIFPKPRLVRFSPSRAESVVTSAPSSVVSVSPPPSVVHHHPPPPPVSRAVRRVPSRFVPGNFPGLALTESSRASVAPSEITTPRNVARPIGSETDDDLYGSSTSTEIEVPDIESLPEIQPPPIVPPLSTTSNDTPTGMHATGVLDEIPIPFYDPEIHGALGIPIPAVEDVPDIPILPDDTDGWVQVSSPPEETPLPPSPPPKEPRASSSRRKSSEVGKESKRHSERVHAPQPSLVKEATTSRIKKSHTPKKVETPQRSGTPVSQLHETEEKNKETKTRSLIDLLDNDNDAQSQTQQHKPSEPDPKPEPEPVVDPEPEQQKRISIPPVVPEPEPFQPPPILQPPSPPPEPEQQIEKHIAPTATDEKQQQEEEPVAQDEPPLPISEAVVTHQDPEPEPEERAESPWAELNVPEETTAPEPLPHPEPAVEPEPEPQSALSPEPLSDPLLTPGPEAQDLSDPLLTPPPERREEEEEDDEPFDPRELNVPQLVTLNTVMEWRKKLDDMIQQRSTLRGEMKSAKGKGGANARKKQFQQTRKNLDSMLAEAKEASWFSLNELTPTPPAQLDVTTFSPLQAIIILCTRLVQLMDPLLKPDSKSPQVEVLLGEKSKTMKKAILSTMERLAIEVIEEEQNTLTIVVPAEVFLNPIDEKE